MLSRFFALASIVVTLLCGIATASAQSTASTAGNPGLSAQLVVGGTDPIDPAAVWLGIHVRLEPGWHTYWRSPGDAGAAPEFRWGDSPNVVAADVEWPAPQRITVAGIDSVGYVDEVLFPAKIHLRDPSATVDLSLALTLYVCSTICMREEMQLVARIDPAVQPGEQASTIDGWRRRVPRTHSPALTIASLTLLAGPPAELRIETTGELVAPDVFVESEAAVVAGRPRIESGRGAVSVITLPLEGADAVGLVKPLRVTLVDGERSIEAVLPLGSGQEGVAPRDAPLTALSGRAAEPIWTMILVALLGGLILNFMPCVFPILSLKLFSLIAPASPTDSPRTQLLATAAGVVASFLALAAALAAFKAAGARIGWGIQFQQPVFLIVMAAILMAFAANLLGLYELRLPLRLGPWFGRAPGHNSFASHFVSGLVMTLLATPCSAPFVGTAVAFALSQDTVQILAIFFALGLGMAAPYVVLAAIPGLGRLLPRPGQWMEVLRKVAALALSATAVWLLTILAEIAGFRIAMMTAAMLGMLLWLLAVYRRRYAHVIAAALVIGISATAFIGAGKPVRAGLEVADDGVRWQPFVPQAIQAKVRSGATVFVDISAAWCVTCKVNEAMIINSEAIRRRLASDVTPVRADWTKTDDSIAAYLQSFGRYGLPFNVVFGPEMPEGIILPELLSQDALLAAFDRASSHASPR